MKLLEMVKTIATHRYLALILRLYIGGLFIYASMYKINYAGEFAETIASYQILPYWGVNITAIVMPWLEFICGTLLIIGVRSNAASVFIIGMLVLFSAAIFVNLIRGTNIGCGCFHGPGSEMNWATLARDLIWTAMAVHVYLYDSAFQLEQTFMMRVKDL